MLPPVGNFLSEVGAYKTAGEVLRRLDMPVFDQRALSVLGMWHLPRLYHITSRFKFSAQSAADLGSWVLDTNLFLHPKIPKEFWPTYQREATKNGLSYTTWLIRQTSAPFTFAEAEAAAKKMLNQNGAWVFDFMRAFGFVDGLFCPFRRWCFVFVSHQKLALVPVDRWLISAAANAAVGRIELLTKKQAIRPTPKLRRPLTEREQEILQQRAILGDNVAVASVLGLSTRTIERHLTDARHKFGVERTSQACLAAFKYGLIEY